MTTVVWILVLLLVVLGICQSIVIIPPTNRAVVTRLGNRRYKHVTYPLKFILGQIRHEIDKKTTVEIKIGRALDEGFHFILPFGIDGVEELPYDLENTPVEVEVPTRDEVKIKLNGTIQWRPALPHSSKVSPVTPRTPNNWLRLVESLLVAFVEINTTDQEIKDGLGVTVKNELLILAGACKAKDLIAKRDVVRLILNTALRLPTPPHRDQSRFITSSVPEKGKYLARANEIRVGEVAPERWIDFYEKNREAIQSQLDDVSDRTSNSPTELLYGIDVATFQFSGLTFSKEYLVALEAKKTAEATSRALNEQVKAKVEHMKKMTDVGISADVAAADMSTMQGTAGQRQVVQLVGLGGGTSVPILNLTLGK